MADVFISYKREERARVERIARALQALGLSVWFDASLEGGHSFHAQINTEARSAKCVLVCWTPAAAHSEWVIGEAEIGRTRGVLAPVLLAPTDLPPPFNTLHAFDLMRWQGDHGDAQWLALLDRLGVLVGRADLRRTAQVAATGEPARAVRDSAATKTVTPLPSSSLMASPFHRVDASRSDDNITGTSSVSQRIGAACFFFGKLGMVVLSGLVALGIMRRWALLAFWATVFVGAGWNMSVNGYSSQEVYIQGAWIANLASTACFFLLSLIPRRFREGFVRGLGFDSKA